MKKILFFTTAVLALLFSFIGCDKSEDYSAYLTELRQDVFFGENENLSLSANYGFKTENGKRVYSLCFYLKKSPFSQTTYNLELTFNNIIYKTDFSESPLHSYPAASFKIENFNEKNFIVKVKYGSNTEEITLVSQIPENALSYTDALKTLWQNQSELMQTYYDENGNFAGEITERVIVKNQKPYYYVGLVKNGKLKALLIEGFSGELLAIREVF